MFKTYYKSVKMIALVTDNDVIKESA
jgi:hypothetical protein